MDIKCYSRKSCCSEDEKGNCTAALEDVCDEGLPVCGKWDNPQTLCLDKYPESCELREFCQNRENKEFRRADYADRQRSGSGSY